MKANLDSSQIFCNHCEEIVHAYAVHCPYCNKRIDRGASSKIAEMSTPTPIPSPVVALPAAEQVLEEESASALPETFTVLISLASLLAASFFFFFGVIIKLFSTNGTFVLEWNVGCWPYFVGSSLILLCLGLYALSNLDRE